VAVVSSSRTEALIAKDHLVIWRLPMRNIVGQKFSVELPISEHWGELSAFVLGYEDCELMLLFVL
jgi:hypothetical protein